LAWKAGEAIMKKRLFLSAGVVLSLVALISVARAVLLGVSVTPPVISYLSAVTTATSYNPVSQVFSVVAPDVTIQFGSTEPTLTVAPPRSMTISVKVDHTGALVGSVGPGPDLVITGKVTRVVGTTTNVYFGLLLTGQVTAFGYGYIGGGVADFDLRFTPTGGLLQPFYTCDHVGITLVSETSTFIGSFTTNFHGQAKGTVGLEDLIPPTVICPASTNVECNGGGAYVTYPPPVGSDNCDTNLTFVYTPPSGSFFALEPTDETTNYTVTLTAIDASGNSNSCSFTVTVEDNSSPVLNVANPIIGPCQLEPFVLTNDPGQCSATFTFPIPTAYDECCTNDTTVTVSAMDEYTAVIIPLMNNGNGTMTGHFPVTCTGSNVITSVANDVDGNTTNCICIVYVVNTQPPVIQNCSNQVVECTASTPAGGAVSFQEPTAYGNCPNLTISCVPTNGSVLPLGTNVIVYTASDCSGNTNQCTFDVIVQDTMPPTISCPSNVTVTCSQSTDPSITGTATATDTCDPNPVVTFTDAAGPVSCTGIPGINRTWKATDASGNSSTCVQSITYTNTTAPTITVPTGSNLGCNPATPPTDASITALVTATDTCGVPTVNVSHVDTTTGCVVTRTFTVTATDGCGNASAAQTVVYSWTADTTPPTVTVPTGSNLGCNPATLPTDASVKALVTASDNCGVANVTVTHVDSGTACAMTRTFTVTATDACGNASAAQTVVYSWTVDTTAPTVTVPTGSSLGCNPTTLPTDASVKALVTATGTCSTPTVSVSHVDATSGCTLTRTFTVTATDACGNASAAQTVVYSWTVDTTAPIVTFPTGSSLGCNPATLPTVASVKALVTATDTCSTPTVNVTSADATAGCVVTRTFTVTATDACGNASAAQTVVYSWTVDTTAPIVTVPTGSSLGCNPTTLPTVASVKALVTATDTCSTPTVNVTSADATAGCVVTRTFTVTATDACGNASAAQTVVYSWTADTTAPIVTVPTGSSLGCNPTTLPTVASVKALVTATDTCSTPTVNVTSADTTTGCVVTRTFTVTATDACGNASAAQTVVYSWTADTAAPSITCPAAVTVQCASNVPTANVASVSASASCGTVTVTWVGDVITNQTCPNRYTVLRTYKAVDPCGNSATCTQTITVNDTTKPSITCPTNITVSALSLCTNAVPATNPTIAAFLHGVTATDNCGGTATVTNNAPSTFPLGTNTVTFTATDSCGNTNKCQASVIVQMLPLNCEPIQCIPSFCQHHFDGFGNCQFATFEGNLTLPNGDQPCDFRTASNTFVAVSVTIGTNTPTVVYCKSQNPCTVQSDGCGGEAWEYFGNSSYERAICRFTDNQCYNSLIDPNLPSSSATGNRNCGALSTVSIGATSTRFYYGFQQARQPITLVCDGMVLLTVSNNVASSPFPFSQSGKTIQCTFPERLVPGNTLQWYATGSASGVSSNCLIYTQQTSATGNSTATYYNDGGSCEIQCPTGGINYNSADRSACVQVMIGQPGVSSKVGCFTFCEPLNSMGNRDWQYGQCSSFQDEFEQESDDDWGSGNW
jgi:hypothetical protein